MTFYCISIMRVFSYRAIHESVRFGLNFLINLIVMEPHSNYQIRNYLER